MLLMTHYTSLLSFLANSLGLDNLSDYLSYISPFILFRQTGGGNKVTDLDFETKPSFICSIIYTLMECFLAKEDGTQTCTPVPATLITPSRSTELITL